MPSGNSSSRLEFTPVLERTLTATVVSRHLARCTCRTREGVCFNKVFSYGRVAAAEPKIGRGWWQLSRCSATTSNP